MRQAQGYSWTRVRQITISALATLLFLAGALVEVNPASADDAQDARQLVEKARLTFDSFQADPQLGPNLRALVHRAKGVMIYPQVLRGAFLFGASGGNGVFLTRHREGDTWAGPAFYAFGEASFGLQAGGEASEVVNGELVAVARVLEVPSGRQVAVLSTVPRSAGQIGSPFHLIDSSGENGCILLYTEGKGLELFDGLTGRRLAQVAGHVGSVRTSKLSSDGRRLVTGGDDQTVRLWDTATGRELFSFRYAGAVLGGAVSPDGRSIVTASRPSSVTLFSTAPWVSRTNGADGR